MLGHRAENPENKVRSPGICAADQQLPASCLQGCGFLGARPKAKSDN